MQVSSTYIMWLKLFKPFKVPTMIGSIVVVGVLTRCALLHSTCDLKAIRSNVQCCLIWELMLYAFELGHNDIETTKNIFCTKGEGSVDHRMVTRWFKKFSLGCKNFDDHLGLKLDFETMLQATEAYLASSTWRVSGKFGISQSSVVYHLHDLSKNNRGCQIVHQALTPSSNTSEWKFARNDWKTPLICVYSHDKKCLMIAACVLFHHFYFHFVGQFYPFVHRREQVTISRLHIGHSSLTPSFILRQGQQPQCLTCQMPFAIKYSLIEFRAFNLMRNFSV